jgi:prepilin-type N-terminal cleavage/methylation domain-containing protein
MTKKIYGGFTLIELLVVVLIIGILAAIAVPQYQRAVDKSKFMEIMSNTAALKRGCEVYYLTNGEYPPQSAAFETLDIEPPQKCARVSGDNTFNCPDSWYDINADHIVSYNGARNGTPAPRNGYRVYFDNTASRGVRQCIASDGSQRAIDLCKALGGVLSSGTVYVMK